MRLTRSTSSDVGGAASFIRSYLWGEAATAPLRSLTTWENAAMEHVHPVTVALLTDRQEAYIRELAKELGMSMAAILRGLVDAAMREAEADA